MRNLKKRILSFVSAVAMAATMLPSVSLFASAADTVFTFGGNNSSGDFKYQKADGSEYNDIFAPVTDYYGKFEKGVTATSKTQYSFVAGETYTISLTTAVQKDENKAYHFPTISVNGKEVGDFGSLDVTDKDKGISTPAADFDGNVFRYTSKVTFTPDANVTASVVLTFTEDVKRDRVGFKDLTISSEGGDVPPTPVTTYTVSAASADETMGTASVDKATVEEGGTAVFTATPKTGYEFVSWSDGSTENPYTATITADTALTATFKAVGQGGEDVEVVIGEIVDSFTLDWNSNHYIDFDLTGYKSAKIVAEVSNGDYFQVRASDPSNNSVNLHEGNFSGTYTYEFTAEDLAKYTSGSRVYFKGNSGTVTSAKIIGVRDGGDIPIPSGNFEVVGPYKAGSVSVSGSTYTAKASNSRDYKFVGWYSDAECATLVTSEASTTAAEGTLYAKFDYVTYNMPIIDIKTSSNNGSFDEAFPAGAPKSTSYKGSSITIANTDYALPQVNETDAEGTVTGTRDMTVQIKGRGNSTWQLDKKPFQLSFESKVSLFGNGAANKKWVLLANHADRTLLRNQVAYNWAKSALSGIPFTTSTQPVELYINGDYQGVYLIVEQTEVNPGRVDITLPTEETTDINNIGFLAELDNLAESNGTPQEDYYVKVGGDLNQYFTIKNGVYTPDTALDANGDPTDTTTSGGNNTNKTAIAIGNYLNEVSLAMQSGDQTAIESYVDMNSLVDMFILQEFAKNCDVGGSSFYMSKDVGGKLTFNPPWDFDRGFGNDTRGLDPTGLYSADANNDNVNKWFVSLWKQTWFQELVSTRWTALRNNAATDPKTTTLANIDNYASTQEASVNRNFNEWNVLNTNTGIYGEVPTPGTYANGVDTMKDWITKRVAFLDTAFNYEDPSVQKLTINAADYTDMTYRDRNVDNVAIPFVVNDTTNDITIKIPVKNAGSDTWANVFGPSGANITWSPAGNHGDESASSVTKTFEAVQKYYNQVSGEVVVTIPAGAPTGTYYVGITSGDLDSITAVFTNPGDVEELRPSASEFTVTVSANPTNGGTVAVQSGDVTDAEKLVVAKGGQATVMATPAAGYEFVNWTNNGKVVSTALDYSFTVTSNMNLVANFSEPIVTEAIWEGTQPLSWTAGSKEIKYFNPLSDFKSISKIVFELNTSSGAQFQLKQGREPFENHYDVSGDFEITDPTLIEYMMKNHSESINVNGTNATLTAIRVTGVKTDTSIYKLAAEVAKGQEEMGTAVVAESEAKAGSSVIFKATLNEGYGFDGWTDKETNEVVSFDLEFPMVVKKDTTLVANFVKTDPREIEKTIWEGSIITGNWDTPRTAEFITSLQNFESIRKIVLVVDTGMDAVLQLNNGEAPYSSQRVITDLESDLLVNVTLQDRLLDMQAKDSVIIGGKNTRVKRIVVCGVPKDTIEKYRVVTTTHPFMSGLASPGGQTVDPNGQATVIATTPNPIFDFINWTDANTGEVVSDSPEYTFTVTKDTSLVANFKTNAAPEGDILDDAKTYTISANYRNLKFVRRDNTVVNTKRDTTRMETGYLIPDAVGAQEEIAYPFTLTDDADVKFTVNYNTDRGRDTAYANLFAREDTQGVTFLEGPEARTITLDGVNYKRVAVRALPNGENDQTNAREDIYVYGLNPGDYIYTTWLPTYVSFLSVDITAVLGDEHMLHATYENRDMMAYGTIEDNFSSDNQETIMQELVSGSAYTIIARANTNGQFMGWYDENGKLVTYNARHVVTMGDNDIHLAARFVEKTQETKDLEGIGGSKNTIIKGTETPRLKNFNNEDLNWYWDPTIADPDMQGSNDRYNTANSTLDITSVPDAVGVVDHNVWKIDYKFNPNANFQPYEPGGTEGRYMPYAGYYFALNGLSASIEDIEGFTFWYRTDPGVGPEEKFVYVLQSNAFTKPLDQDQNGGITAFLSGTDGVWTKAYVPFDPTWANEGATEVTEWDMFVNKNGRLADGSEVTMTSDKGSFYIADFDVVSNDLSVTDGKLSYNYEFVYKDIFRNTLKTETQTIEVDATLVDGKWVPNDGVPTANPNPPEYVQVQGRVFQNWRYNDIATATSSNLSYAELKAKSFAPGTYTFVAQYKLDPDKLTVSVQGGDLYISADKDDTKCTYKVPASAAGDDGRYTEIPYFGNVRLVANDKNRTFSHWELNGMVYSYDKEIFFSTWCDASFVAKYTESEQVIEPTAFIDEFVHIYGFDNLENNNQHRIIYDTSFYAGNVDIVEAGIIYAATEEALDLAGLPQDADISLSTLKAAVRPAGTAVISLLDSQLNSLTNGTQYLTAISTTKPGKTRIARSYLIYTDNVGTRHIVYSEGLAKAVTPSVVSEPHIIQKNGETVSK